MTDNARCPNPYLRRDQRAIIEQKTFLTGLPYAVAKKDVYSKITQFCERARRGFRVRPGQNRGGLIDQRNREKAGVAQCTVTVGRKGSVMKFCGQFHARRACADNGDPQLLI